MTACQNCGEQITLHNFAMGPGWTHEDATLNGYTYCRLSVASPAQRSAEEQLLWDLFAGGNQLSASSTPDGAA